MNDQNDQNEAGKAVKDGKEKHFKKFWLAYVAAILIASGIAGITYYSFSESTKSGPTPTASKANVTPTPSASTDLKDTEKAETDLNADIIGLDKELTDITNTDTTSDVVPAI
ncbi:MAG: hypothetical protein UT66_C0030G0005 [candidate division CPR2 bacterium GW2011_GWC1_39_9]|uniref:Uncharacterized protein n=1 Tax=candidate division CPR2 bacterium GW2011_GWC2_39_10 TaxID=1618345 RepID=A0A0G0PWF2_UNCC2|nr:MAG: hypothetical protein UT18_C0017G0006 [candidate division CPR2 bacterium GW2011_GWC2_39_10]KKR34039.1 MAG: hypothetical protein UT66_C0030G0005 [candidate division CPR2 bacterium GW2011_GWC1_39_9]